MLNSIGPVIARRRDAETVTYCWEHSVHPSVHSHATVHANNNRMSGTHHCDGSSRASHLYRHPQDASQYADSKAVEKQQAFANLHGVLAKNSATLNEATDRESHQYDADTYARAYGDDSHNHPHDIYSKVVTNTGCYAIALQQNNTSKSATMQDRWDIKQLYVQSAPSNRSRSLRHDFSRSRVQCY